MWKATLRGFLAHRFRLVLTLLAVVLGVGFVSGTFVLTDTMNATFDSLFDDIFSQTDVVVRAQNEFDTQNDERPLLPDSVLNDVRAVDGVAIADGGVDGFAQMVDADGEPIGGSGPPTLGVSIANEEDFRVLFPRDGRLPAGPGEVAVDATTARRNDIEVGARLTILFEASSEEFEVVGIVGFGSADNLGGATLAAFTLPEAQRVLDAEGRLDAVSVRAAEGVTAAELRTRIDAALPDRYQVVTATDLADEQAQTIQEALGFFRTALLVFAGVAVFVGAFIIFNTFNILVTQRTRELGLLRAVGAGRGQVMRSILLEATLTGLVAAGLGLGFGILTAAGLRALLDAFGLSLPTTTLQVLPRTVVVAVAVGLIVTIAASLLPGKRAATITPMEALREGESVRPVAIRARALAGAVLLALGVAAMLRGLLAASGSLNLVGIGIAAVFLAVTLLSPLAAMPITRALSAPLARFGRVAGRLGGNNAQRNPRRTAATASALMIGLALVGTFTIMGSSVKASVGVIIEQTLRADVTLQPTSQFGGFSHRIARMLSRDERFAAVVPIRYAEFRDVDSDTQRFLTAADPATIEQVMALDLAEGSLADLGEGVLIHDSVAEAKDVGVGDEITLIFPNDGPRDLVVAGVFRADTFIGDYLISMSEHERLYTSRLDSMVLVKNAPGVDPGEARAIVDEVAAPFANVEVQNQAEFRQAQEEQIDQLLALINALLALAIIIALLGIVNTLALSVFERTRELGLLRAVGMSRRQTRRMVRWESVVIALFGGVLGLATGLLFGTILVGALADEGITELSIPAISLVGFMIMAGVAGIIAAIGPARRAARLDVLRAIAYE